MWSTTPEEKDTESLLKETLLRQLSHAVKEVQLFYSQTSETCTTQEGITSLILILEAIFLHAIKLSILDSARRTISAADDHRPSPAFFNAVRSVTHKNTEAQILNLPLVNTPVGRSRVWIRLALNDSAMPSYMSTIAFDKRVPRYYRPQAFLRDKEALDTAAHLMEGLMQVPFDVPLNSSLLNVWSAEPLHTSGVWCPAMRETVQIAVDVAGGIEIEDDGTMSLRTASSSMHSLVVMDSDQAIENWLESIRKGEPKEEAQQEKEERKEDELGKTEVRSIMVRSFSSLVESVSPRLYDVPEEPNTVENERSYEDIKDTQVKDVGSAQVEEKEEQIAKPGLIHRHKKESEDFNTLVRHNYATNEPDLSLPECDKVKPQQKEDLKRNIQDVILTIQQEIGLRLQKFECADCQLSIGLNFGTAILCHVTGEYLCENCHLGDTQVVPARVLYNWDFTKYPSGKRALEYLSSQYKEPVFDLKELNPLLSNAVPELKEIEQVRRQLKFLNQYLLVCKESVEINARDYLYLATDKYSLADLAAIPGGYLKSEISKLVEQARGHVIGCWICKQKGFICELCRDPQVIYPFDAGSVYRCNKCNAVYHGQCLKSDTKCPKCQRKKKRDFAEKMC